MSNMLNHEVIYLIDAGDEIVWCEDPAPGTGMDESEAVRYIRADQTPAQIKADAINEFVCSMIGALESGFIEPERVSLATLHRVMQNHVKDSFGIELPHITEQWGVETAKLCGYPLCGEIEPQEAS
jgi:hypothetical protein